MRKHLYFGFIVVLIILSLTVLFGEIRNGSIKSSDSGNLKITNLDRLIFTKNGEFTI